MFKLYTFIAMLQVSLQGKQLMYRLLHRDPKNRLGSREGANEVKQHPFFRGINWALVRCMVTVWNSVLVLYMLHIQNKWTNVSENPSESSYT